MSRLDALVDACHKRARPILMTTIARVAGMLPIALGLAFCARRCWRVVDPGSVKSA